MLRLLVSFVLLFSFPHVQFAQRAHIETEVFEAFSKRTTVEYIVWFKDRPTFPKGYKDLSKHQKAGLVYYTLLEKAQNAQKDILAYIKGKNLPYQSFYITNAIKVTSDIQDMLWIANRPETDWIFYNQPIKMLDYEEEKISVSVRNIEPEWGIKMIQADSVWTLGYDGTGVVIGGQDTGYDWEVSPLKSKYRGFVDSTLSLHDYHWHDAIHEKSPAYPDSLINPCGFNSKIPCDDNNHGTHTMGTMVGRDDENMIGVAPGAKWIGCRNMDRGWGSPATYMECFEWFLAPYDAEGQNADPSAAPHVINNSWYCPEAEGCNLSNFYLMNDVVNNLKASGIVVVVSAGNSGRECSTISGPPAIFENSFTIGATTEADTIARFSSRGLVTIDSSFRMKPNVSAPGARVRSVVRGGNFANFSGTSMAGPHAAGLVALIISANPELAGKVDEIEDIIELTATRKTIDQDCNDIPGNNIPNAVYGFGRINALDAVHLALSVNSKTHNIGENNPLQVFPNPAHDQVSFVIKSPRNAIMSVALYTTNGQVVYEVNQIRAGVASLPVSQLQSGLYIYRLTDIHGKIYSGKITKW